MNQKYSDNPIKMIALDLDGTLLDRNLEVSSENLLAINTAHQRGVKVLIATGRTFDSLPQQIRNLAAIDYTINCNGSMIMDKNKAEILYQKNIPIERIEALLKEFASYNCIVEIAFRNVLYVQEIDLERQLEFFPEEYHEYVLKTKKSLPDYSDIRSRFPEGANKLLLFFSDPDERAQFQQKYRAYEDLTVSASSTSNIEINAAGISKKQALLKLAERFSIQPEEVLAIGDSLNDLEMIQWAGIGVAMGNAETPVKEAADFVTGSNQNDGVALAINQFVLETR